MTGKHETIQCCEEIQLSTNEGIKSEMKSLLEYIIKSDGHRLSQDSNSMRGKGASFPSVEIIKRHRFISDGLRRSKIFYKNHISSRPFFFTLNLKEFMPHHYCILATVPRNFYTFYVFKKKENQGRDHSTKML